MLVERDADEWITRGAWTAPFHSQGAVVPELAECYKVAALNAFRKLSMRHGGRRRTPREETVFS